MQCQTQLLETVIQVHGSHFYGETYITDGHKPAQSKITTIVEMPSPSSKKRGTIIYWHDKLLIKILTQINRTC